jgi:hypothetical protein
MTSTNKNLSLWNAVETTDPHYTKSFTRGGGFKGTATNATYLAKKATMTFGPIGIGWGWTVLDERLLEGADDTLIHRVHLRLWYKWEGERGEIEHFGQTEFSGKRNNGKTYTDEEAPKKSLTDAVTKCLSLIGFASDIHLGLYDDNKYVNSLKKDFANDDEFTDRDDRRETKKEDQKQDTKKAAPKKAGSGNDNARSEDDRADNEGADDEPMSDDELVGVLKEDIDRLQTVNAVTDYMLHKDTVKDLSTLPKDMSEEVRAYAKQRLADLGWPSGGKKAG